MPRWTAEHECYLVDKNYRVLGGPFDRTAPLIALIDRLYHQSNRQYGYSNASRYSLAKYKVFPRTKAGDAALVAANEHPDLEALVVPLLGRQGSGLGSGYENPDWEAIDALLTERGILPGGPAAPSVLTSGASEKVQ